MKKIFLVIIVVIVAVSGFVACVSTKSPVYVPTQDKTEEPSSEDGEGVYLSTEDKEALYNGAYGQEASEHHGTYYGVGRTINVITDPWINVSSGYARVFDTQKLLGLNWHKTFRGEMNSSVVSGTSMESFYDNFNAKIESEISGGINSNIFSASLENKFGFFAGITYRQTANEIMLSASQVYKANLIEIDGYYDLDKFSEILSDNLLQDIEALEIGTMQPESFVYKYGTHVVLAGYYGGRVDANYYMQNLDEKWDTSLELNYQNKVGGQILKIFSADINTAFSIKNELGITSNKVTEQFSASSVGGDNFQALSLTDFLANYGDWASSMNDQTDYSNLVDLPNRSLVAIWDLFPSQYSVAKQSLSEYFNVEANNVSDDFLSKYSRYYTQPDDNGDTTNFSGGFGTESQPYLIANKTQFQNINKNSSTGKYFKLLNSVDLGIWNSPFAFGGNLDGDGYTINFVQTISTKGAYYGGLFTQLNDATISNLHLDVLISRDLDRGDTGMVGALAGKASGNTKLYRIETSGQITIGNYSGFDYVGGIVGHFLGGTIAECANHVNVTSKARHARSGGIAGYACPQEMPITISNCYNTGNLLSSSNYTAAFAARYSGGILGQAKGHNTFELNIKNCYNDSSVKLEWTGVATGGWNGKGGLIGDIADGKSTNIKVSDSYWNSSKCQTAGNNSAFHKSNGKSNMTGIYSGWSNDIWVFSQSSAPELTWLTL